MGFILSAIAFVLSVKFIVGFVAGAAAGWGTVKTFASKAVAEAKKLGV